MFLFNYFHHNCLIVSAGHDKTQDKNLEIDLAKTILLLIPS